MKRGFALFAVVFLAAAWVHAQGQPGQPQPARKAQPEPTLQGEQKLRWICE